LVALSDQQPDLIPALQHFIDAGYEEAAPLLKMQMILASSKLSREDAFDKITRFLDTYGVLPVARDVAMSALQDREYPLFLQIRNAVGDKAPEQKEEIFMEMLATAIMNSRKTDDIKQMLSMLNPGPESAVAWVQSAIVNGMLNARESDNSTAIALEKKPAVFAADQLEANPLLAQLQDRFYWPGKPEKKQQKIAEEYDISPEVMAQGRKQFLNLCASCHGTQGEGMKRFAPPLKNSQWVNGEDYKIAMILLYGMEGPVAVKGKVYDIPDILPAMPSFSTLQDEDLAAIATYVRNSWGNSNPPLSRGLVGGIRFRTQGKIQPWKASELDTIQFSME